MTDMGTGMPRGLLDYIIVAISVGVVLLSLYLCVRYFFRPKENEDDHIKKTVLDDEIPTDRGRLHERR
jgi:hypothetical protein